MTMHGALTQFTAAKQYVECGFSIFAVPPPRPGVPKGEPGDGKTPAAGVRWKHWQIRQPTVSELVAMFGGEFMNIAIVTGPISGHVVIDADNRQALRYCTERLPYTPRQTKTGRGWYHLWYRHPGVRVPNRARIQTGDGRFAIDVRGDGGYVIGPGSLHASGATYLEAGDWSAPLTDVPLFDPAWLAGPTTALATTRPTAAHRSDEDVLDRARRYLAAIPPPHIGQGSDAMTLSAACRLVRGFALPAMDAEALLWDWCGGRTGWTREWVARKVAHAERYGTEAIGGLR